MENYSSNWDKIFENLDSILENIKESKDLVKDLVDINILNDIPREDQYEPQYELTINS